MNLLVLGNHLEVHIFAPGLSSNELRNSLIFLPVVFSVVFINFEMYHFTRLEQNLFWFHFGSGEWTESWLTAEMSRSVNVLRTRRIAAPGVGGRGSAKHV